MAQQEDVERQIQRLKDYAAAKGYQVSKVVTEIACGLNDQRAQLSKLLADTSIGTIVVENRDRLTRFGSHYIESLLAAQARHLEMSISGESLQKRLPPCRAEEAGPVERQARFAQDEEEKQG